jgi:hypothetical protein
VARAPGEPGAAPIADEPAAPARETPREAPQAPDAGAELARRVRDALPAERLEILREFVRDKVVRVLRLDPGQPPDRQARLMDLGFDSLMAVQLRNQLGQGLKLAAPLPATVLFDYPTIDRLAARLVDIVAPSGLAPAEVPVPAPTRVGAAALEALSDADVEKLLLERLKER